MIFSKRLSAKELRELRAINKLLKQERFKLNVVSANTALVFRGQNYTKTQADVVKVLELAQEALISQSAERLGYTQGTPIEINLESGKISIKKPSDTRPQTF